MLFRSDLLELRPVGLSLEDIFMQLTREEPEPPSVAEDADDGELLNAVEDADEFVSGEGQSPEENED